MMATWSAVKKSELESKLRIDAEYYQPTFLQLAKFLKAQPQTQLLRVSLSRPIHRGTLPQYDESGEVYVIKTNNVRNDFLVFDAPEFTTEEFYKANPRGRVEQYDVLMTSTGRGTLGRCNVFGESFKAYAAGHIALIRPDHQRLDPFYLYIYLVSKFGQLQIERAYTGSTGQIEIYPDHISNLLVFAPPREFQTNVRMAVIKAHELKRRSETLYLQAAGMALDEIGWDKLDLSQPKWRTVPLSRAREVHRLDAEHFRPKYDKLMAHMRKKGKTKQIGDILAHPIQKGVTPDYDPDGSVMAVNSRHLGRYGLDFEATDRTTEAFWAVNTQSQIRENDIMIYATGAYIGRTNSYLESGHALAGVDILLVRPTDECNPLYLAVFLNSPPGLMQSKMCARGSGQAHIYPDDVGRYCVYLPSGEFQQRVANLVQESYQTRKRAKTLLQEAKHRVEALIEGTCW